MGEKPSIFDIARGGIEPADPVPVAPVEPAPMPLSTDGHQDWCTPLWLFKQLNADYAFGLDAAASAENALCEKFYDGSEGRDGLVDPWDAWTFCNPPYGRARGGIGAWLAKATYEAMAGNTGVLLLPARLEANWFVTYAKYCETKVLTPRVKFGGHDGTSPPHGSMLMIFSKYSVDNPSAPMHPRILLMRLKEL